MFLRRALGPDLGRLGPRLSILPLGQQIPEWRRWELPDHKEKTHVSHTQHTMSV